MLDVKIQKMQEDDINGIMQIERTSFGTYHWSELAFSNEINNPLGSYFSLIEVDTTRILGYCGFWLIEKEAHITTIAVHPDYRKNFLGELLLQKLIKTGYEKDAKWFTLEVRAGNAAAQRLYEKYGFESLGTRKKYYQDNDEDALIMWTENIWEEKFKTLFKKLEEELTDKKTYNVVGG
ncbi:MAG: ribosomal protein S18-alanine N-acetyltransferase [Candidatus Gastranaerophilales bacterium]|nr:ribosomal protein S18-alanine N-acetyltransferase [Candidatus Gastranaerophilales bacterium]